MLFGRSKIYTKSYSLSHTNVCASKQKKSLRACFSKYMIRLLWCKILQPQNSSFVFLGRLGYILFWTLNFLPGGGGWGIRINFRWGPIRSEWKKIFKIHALKFLDILALKKESYCLFRQNFKVNERAKNTGHFTWSGHSMIRQLPC